MFLTNILWKKELVKINGCYVFLTPLCMSSSFKSHFDYKYVFRVPPEAQIIILDRDPVDRFLSFYNKKVLGRELSLRKKIWYWLRFRNLNGGDSIDNVLMYLKNIPIELRDKHVLPISFFFNYYKKNNEVLVLDPFNKKGKEHLSTYLGDFPSVHKFSSLSRSNSRVNRNELTSTQLEIIKTLFS
jgi:hypothetical protein